MARKALIIGAGKMGLRHALGVLKINELEEVCLIDTNDSALDSAKAQLSSDTNFHKVKFCKPGEVDGSYDFVIIASTAGDRIETSIQALKFNPKSILLEKPLGQSFEQVKQLVDFYSQQKVSASVNLNMRMYPFVKELKSDLQTKQQFNGIKSINFQGGTLGIGANGIHYLDLLFFLFDADAAEIFSGEIDQELIPSGRGPQFGDFGGWACIKFYDAQHKYLGKSIISLSAASTAFGGWDIIGNHGRIRINELEGERVDIIRKSESILPLNRYAGDYLPADIRKIESPFLGDLTKQWIEGIMKGNGNLLPSIQESLKVHQLMFEWLSLSRTHKNIFPIT